MSMQANLHCLHFLNQSRFCLQCSSYVYSKINVHGVKHKTLNRAKIQPESIIDGLRLRLVDLTHNKDYDNLDAQIKQMLKQISSLCTQLHLSCQSKILAMYIIIHSYNNIKESSLLFFVSIFMSLKLLQTNTLKNYQVRSFLLNSIKLELQKEGTSQSLLCFQTRILKLLNYRINIVSFIDFLQFYVIAGVVFNFQSKVNYNKLMNFIDSQIYNYVSTGSIFKQPNQEYLALKILYEARSSCEQIDEIWNIHLEYITKRQKSFVESLIQQKQILKVLNGASIPFRRKRGSSLYERK